MDHDTVVICASLVCALAVGVFILWGPVSHRSRRKPGHINGLANVGNTCFLNTLLQALASCHHIVDWLTHQEMKSDNLTSSLNTVLLVLNGQHSTISENPYTPSNVIASLRLHGWVISPGEQDAHELFHVIMTTLKEETQSTHPQVLSLSDALTEPSKRELCYSRIIPRKKQSDDKTKAPTLSPQKGNFSGSSSRESCPAASIHSFLPFQGLLTSQLQCTTCHYKSPVLYDKFDSLSLSLPSLDGHFMRKLTLFHLLDHYVSTEVVKDVACEGCNQQQLDGSDTIKTNALKTLNFGKLPKCLCFHIQRTTWQQNGQALKRYDHIEFPEVLSMDSYTYTHVQKKKALLEKFYQKGGMSEPNLATKEAPEFKLKHLYRLMAIIVHTGDLENGHFMTYRRDPSHEESWYYTSDTDVRESTLQEALQSCAYMLFYCKK